MRVHIVCVFVVVAILICSSEQSCHNQNPIVETIHGKIKGGCDVSRNGNDYYYFRGIPYAAPPVGDLRLKDPTNPSPWQGIRNGHYYGPRCIQYRVLFYQSFSVVGQEDCLYLNVYTPARCFNNKKCPVIVSIHYGGMFEGSGNEEFGPEYFMDKDVVLVTINYRLGIMGFLSTGDDECPGNFGLKDQTLALKWVQANINNFGGDEKQVTLMGQSAGGVSSHYHMLSPLSKGLFHAAICQSGATLMSGLYPQNGTQVPVTRTIATFAGCNGTASTAEIMKCVRSVPAEELVGTLKKFHFYQAEPIIAVNPSIEVKTERNPNPFITKFPQQIIEEKSYARVPMIMGTVCEEGIFRTTAFYSNKTLYNQLADNYLEYIPQIMGLSFSVNNDVNEANKKMMQFYFKGESLNRSNPEPLIELYGDRGINVGVYSSVLAHAIQSDKIYAYNFCYKGKYTYADKFALTDETIPYKWGVCHCDDLVYQFRTPEFFPEYLNGTDNEMINHMIEFITNFAKYHNPTPINSSAYEKGIIWKPLSDLSKREVVTNSDYKHLKISGNYNTNIKFNMENSYYPERMSFWMTGLGDLREKVNRVI